LVGEDPLIRLWDVASGQIIAHLRQQLGQINCVVYCPDGRTLVTAAGRNWPNPNPGGIDRLLNVAHTDGDPGVRIWDLATGKSRILFRHRPDGFRVVAISPDGKTVAAGSLDGSMRVSSVPIFDEGR